MAPTPAKPASALTQVVGVKLQSLTAVPATPASLHSALRHLAKWRAELLANTVLKRSGTKVVAGPFQGMDYALRASEGSRVARLLGVYEAALHPVIEAIIARAPDLVIDIGSAEGYYAVGFARRMPGARVMARDASPRAQDLCRAQALANSVAARVEVGGLFSHADFDICAVTRSVVICDIEGAEDALLDPVVAPGLLHADILVECHPAAAKGVTERISARFAATHRIIRIDRKLDDSALPEWMAEMSDLDRLLALWEWRTGPTPWLWMEKL
ncbi:hypothetical protein [Tabrizicola sp.]|uniref:hypothetical protein n=1 Tax=Tabrizicola sp. TaxID=2005166 RepID=UPI003D28DCE7